MGTRIDVIMITPALADCPEDASPVEMLDQPPRASLGNSHPIGHVLDTRARIFRQAHQHVRVVTQECPTCFTQVLNVLQFGRIADATISFTGHQYPVINGRNQGLDVNFFNPGLVSG